jgi:predicted nucleotide-binding protein (sugar kinase/HSP70/actin superfamily)
MRTFNVKLSFWTDPVSVAANSKYTAKQRALELYPTCDCCDDATTVDWVQEVMELALA